MSVIAGFAALVTMCFTHSADVSNRSVAVGMIRHDNITEMLSNLSPVVPPKGCQVLYSHKSVKHPG